MAFPRIAPMSIGAAILLSFGASAVHAGSKSPAPTVYKAVRQDVSKPLRDILAALPPDASPDTETEFEIPNILLKHDSRLSAFVRDYRKNIQLKPLNIPAPLADISFNAITSTTSACGCVPPDTNGDVSDQHYIQWVNSSYQIFDKTTGTPSPSTLSPKKGNTLFAGFGGKCQSTNAGDPVALWDARAQRWVMSQFVTSTPYAQCVAVSTTSDPLGTYYRYEFQWPNFGDYPKIGVWTDESTTQDAYLLTTHEFSSSGTGGTFQGAALIAMDRDKMLAGQPASMIRYPGVDAYGVQPVNLGGDLNAPANACPAYVHFDANTGEYLFWDLCLNWTNPASSAITPSDQPVRVAGDAFVPFYDSVPQKGSSYPLDSFGSNLMFRATARAFPADAPTRLSLVVNHTVIGGSQQAAIRWVHFDLTDHGVAPAVPTALDKKIVDQGVYAPDANHRWMGSIAIDKSGDIGLGYSNSSSTTNPQIETTGRLLSDPAGTLRDEQNCTTGVAAGSQTGTSGRWGDYSSMSVDPVDQCRFYFTSEYYSANAVSSWKTRVCSFKFPTCGDPDYAMVADSPKRIEMCGATAATDPSWVLRAGVLNGFTAPVTLSANGQPGGVTATFATNPIAAPGSSNLTLTGGAALPTGEYTFSVDGVSGALTRSVGGFSLGISEHGPGRPQLVAPADTSTGAKVRPTLSWQEVPTTIDDRVFGDGFDGAALPTTVPTSSSNSYLVEVATDAGFANIVASATVAATSWAVNVGLNPTTQYFWRVTPTNYCGPGATSETFSFTTGVPGQCPSGTTSTTLLQNDVTGWTTDGTGGTAWSRMTPPSGAGLTGTVWGIPNNTVTSDRGLISPAVTIPAGAKATILSFDTFHHFEDNGPGSCWDNGSMQLKGSSGAFAYLDGSRLFTDAYDGVVASGEVNAGSWAWCQLPTSAPAHSIVDLDGFEGQNVQVRWRAVSDSNTAATAPNGMYVQNVKIEVCQ